LFKFKFVQIQKLFKFEILFKIKFVQNFEFLQNVKFYSNFEFVKIYLKLIFGSNFEKAKQKEKRKRKRSRRVVGVVQRFCPTGLSGVQELPKHPPPTAAYPTGFNMLASS
jgi:hypothetical protein